MLHAMLEVQTMSSLNQTGRLLWSGRSVASWYIAGLVSLAQGGQSEVARSITKNFRVGRRIDRCTLVSSVVLLEEAENLSISSPGMQRLSVWICWLGWCLSLLTDLSSRSWSSVIARPGELYPVMHEFLRCLVKQCSGSGSHITTYRKDGTEEWP